MFDSERPLIFASHYWIVTDHTPSGEVYSSANASYVANTDATYLAWVASGGQVSTIATHNELMDLLQQQHPSGAGIDMRVWRMLVKLNADIKAMKQAGNVGGLTMTFSQDVDALLAAFPKTS